MCPTALRVISGRGFHEKAWFTPTVEKYRQAKPDPIKQIRSEDSTGPVLTFIDPRRANHGDYIPKNDKGQGAPP